jgi:opacity protein-like surface antigen
MKIKTLQKIPVTLLTILANTQIIDASSSTPFNGFYVGTVVGGVYNNLKSKLVVDSLILKAKTNHITGFSYGLMAGYGRNVGKFYLGAEIGILSDTTNKSKNYEYRVLGNNLSFGKIKYQRGVVLSIAPRFGVAFGGAYMVYVKPAFEISKDKAVFLDDENDSDTESSRKKLQYAFVPGIGVEKAFSNIILRTEYAYNLGSKAKKTRNEDGFSVSCSLKYTSHTVKIGVAYKF